MFYTGKVVTEEATLSHITDPCYPRRITFGGNLFTKYNQRKDVKQSNYFTPTRKSYNLVAEIKQNPFCLFQILDT